ncbi:1-acyl-sn-glycerol-3-phosphate acyltransferase alpha [Bombus vosnesenskii]|uniref:1-acyl-sn-glycerol-3-phosphate acyltransferase n=3 Tax=Pyrobombus TaxID=144703 RepID=A0A6J3LNY2_9HYME|nr:1-acyl-sn-glycerol-3-phosphate acyltransferase alpha isoform X1 [Bombus vancouverensis nearcticus]XP_033301113.1 1-acyl-sn-glycerol-3-phosphate acyltransferase alpha isoform X1 [Bombus bifarius]XP_033367198.1 1-acyl-sn-glycerol-3-phosphate acyltransferase alpha [Bombus vosnesenskii]XP_050473326.1 1-acyl-sn-glycerol-3-phosphate acyltransferase alpha isoform X1 [Bombus huntii]XP_050577790.1 1-acyl-sn-glycerol-3-phosphate acyltransferase alpha [Bombus affinis]
MAPSCFEVILVGLFLLIPVLYEVSRTFRYYLKFFLYYGIAMLNSLILLPIVVFRPKNVKNYLLGSAVFSICAHLIGLRWELRGTEHLEKERACIIVSNHQSSLDVLGMYQVWPIMQKCTVIAKKQIFYAWPFGLVAWLCGLIFIDKMQSDKARSILNSAAVYLKEDKIKLWIFPEGTRRNTGQIHSFKKGAFHVAINAQLPILPVVFSSYYFLSSKEKRFDAGRVIITTLPPISTEGLTSADVEDLIEKTRNAMMEVFHATSHEVQSNISS